MVVRVITFLILNFSALAIGGLFTKNGVNSSWYDNLEKAPWTPPGWMFGVAWTIIMIAFALYMAFVWKRIHNKKILIQLYVIQLLLNIAWNPLFFHYQNTGAALINISVLTFLIGFFYFNYKPFIRYKSFLVLPYLVWLIIATSLNGYIFLRN